MNSAGNTQLWQVISDPWILIGFLGQTMFFMRFLTQWVVSERRKESVIPLAFWYFSLGGGLILLAYAIHRQDPVFILGQATGAFIYIRNLMLIFRKRTTASLPHGRS
jgi:lipid-A-disaccharide synthase-like uncharacterized protein